MSAPDSKDRRCGLCKSALVYVCHIVRSVMRWHCEECGTSWCFGSTRGRR